MPAHSNINMKKLQFYMSVHVLSPEYRVQRQILKSSKPGSREVKERLGCTKHNAISAKQKETE